MAEPADPSAGLLVLGDADFDAAPQCRLAGTRHVSADSLMAQRDHMSIRGSSSDCQHLSERRVTALPLSKREVSRVAKQWQEQNGESAVVLTGCEASEDRLKAEAAGKKAIHIATHGYFLGGTCQPGTSNRLAGRNASRNKDPLLLSGLLLAGANRHGEGAAEAGVEDGVLTAQEVAELSLDGTELVVLSACESGLGEVEQGEGVYGLRHSFQIAGARTVVSALWPVSDASAMTTTNWLYQNWNQLIFKRLQSAQMQELVRLRSHNQPDHPVSWSAFITQGDWR